MRLYAAFILLSAWTQAVLAASADDWRSRSIYQVMTDRYGRTDGSTTAKCDAASGVYCGGTWQGIINNLDYIQNMGFTAVRSAAFCLY
jgi:alpha-amylase